MDELKKMTVKEINKRLSIMDIQEYKSYVPALLNDPRKSVKKLGMQFKEKEHKALKEKKRAVYLSRYEKSLEERGYNLIAGLDEAGRGPLAGPVVAAAVILPHGIWIEDINDSKKLSPKKRETIFKTIQKRAISIGIGIVDNIKIDDVNILNATKLAMIEAIGKLNPNPEYLLIDALKLTEIFIEQTSITKGDSKSISIAAASIIAKVTRDKIMERYHEIYPEYGFKDHKGYPTNEHYLNIKRHGITSIHRKSFLKNLGGWHI